MNSLIFFTWRWRKQYAIEQTIDSDKQKPAGLYTLSPNRVILEEYKTNGTYDEQIGDKNTLSWNTLNDISRFMGTYFNQASSESSGEMS